MIILGIETSCDETSVGIVEQKDNQLTIKANVTATSLQLHSKTGGIIPEIAAREQVKYMLPVLQQALKKGLNFDLSKYQILNTKYSVPIDAIAVTYGPGLIGSLLVGVETAKTLSYICNKPIIPVNHMLGHIYANWLSPSLSIINSPLSIQFPALALVVSGGHTDLLLLKNHSEYEVLGGTRDDAAGECFDKCARLLGFDYPGGPKIAELAKKGDNKAFHFPRPMLGSHDADFSFSGLKTSFLNMTKQHLPLSRTTIPNSKAGWVQTPVENDLSDKEKVVLYNLCASLEKAIVDTLVKKTMYAAEEHGVKSILISGGVAANDLLREQFEKQTVQMGINFFAPTKDLCTDNGAMIAAAAFFNNKPVNWQDITVDPELYY